MVRKLSLNIGNRKFSPIKHKLKLSGGGVIWSMFSDPIITQEELNELRNDPLTTIMLSVYDGTDYMRPINAVLGGNPTETQLNMFYFLMDEVERQLTSPTNYENVKLKNPIINIGKNIKNTRH